MLFFARKNRPPNLLAHKNFAPMQILANFLNDASRYIYLVECDVFFSIEKNMKCAGWGEVYLSYLPNHHSKPQILLKANRPCLGDYRHTDKMHWADNFSCFVVDKNTISDIALVCMNVTWHLQRWKSVKKLCSVFLSVINTWNLPSDLVQKMVSYSIHVIVEYNQADSEIICRQINAMYSSGDQLM